MPVSISNMSGPCRALNLNVSQLHDRIRLSRWPDSDLLLDLLKLMKRKSPSPGCKHIGCSRGDSVAQRFA